MSEITNNSTINNNTNNDNTNSNLDVTININNPTRPDLGPNINNRVLGNEDLSGFRNTPLNNMNNYEMGNTFNEQNSFDMQPPYDNQYMHPRDPSPDNIGFRGDQVVPQQQLYPDFDTMMNNQDTYGNPTKMINNNMQNYESKQNFDDFLNSKTTEYTSNNTNILNQNNLGNDVPIYQKDMNIKSETCYLSQVGGSIIKRQIKNILDNIISKKELKIDYNVNKNNKYEFFGRVFTSQESQYTINIYKLEEKDNQNNVSRIEFRKIHGNEGFGFYDFEQLVVEKLRNKKTLPKEENNEFINDFLGSLTLDDDSDEEDMEDYQDDTNDNNNLSLDDDPEFDSELCDSMLVTLYNKNAYSDEYMHDAYQLASYLEKNDNRSKNMMNYIAKKESKKIIPNILEPLKSKDLYCAFIILHVLDIIYALVSNENIKSELFFPDSFRKDIIAIHKTWSKDEGGEYKIGQLVLKVPKSQQITNRCNDIIGKMQN